MHPAGLEIYGDPVAEHSGQAICKRSAARGVERPHAFEMAREMLLVDFAALVSAAAAPSPGLFLLAALQNEATIGSSAIGTTPRGISARMAWLTADVVTPSSSAAFRKL